MALEKKDLVAKLEQISALYADTVAIQTKMDEFTPVDSYSREIVVPKFPGEYASEQERNTWKELVDHDREDAIEQMDTAYIRAKCPKEPVKPTPGMRPVNEGSLVKQLKQKLGYLPLVAGFIAVCSLISGGLFSGDAGTVIGNLVVLAACAAAGFFYYKKHKSAEEGDKEATELMIRTYEEEKKEAEEKYQQDMEKYQTDHAAYVLAKANFMEAYTAWAEVYCAHLKEEKKIKEKLEADRAAGVEKIYREELVPAQNKLQETNDLISENYLPVLDVIIELIKSGRADDLKEAVNLYEEMVYRERQLQLQREQEEQRRREEEQRRQDEERRHREEMKFRQDQERQRQREEEQRRADDERRHREDMRAREAEERSRQLAEKERIRKEQYNEHMSRVEQERKQRNAAQAQCRACAHAGRCNMMVHNSAPTCTGFTPRR